MEADWAVYDKMWFFANKGGLDCFKIRHDGIPLIPVMGEKLWNDSSCVSEFKNFKKCKN